MNYTELDKQLQGRNKDSRKIANNTYLHRINGDIAMRLHNTDVVTFKANGDKILNSGGWHTNTTKGRINMAGVRMYQDKGVWYINGIRFADGITVKANGKIKGGLKDTPQFDLKYKLKVKAYAKMYADAIPLDKPSSGDCWYCLMKTTDGDNLGDKFKDTTHLDSHIKESYIVPSLAYNALKEAGNTDFIMSLVFNKYPDRSFIDLAQERVYKAVYKYILKRKGYAV